jgi:hypothetical protein
VHVIPDVDIDLRLVPADQPGSVRRPDLVVVDSKAINHRRVHHQRAVPRAATARPADLNWPAPSDFRRALHMAEFQPIDNTNWAALVIMSHALPPSNTGALA